ncbi:hypothetical protein HZH68_006102 [Vespula germanica]|uniref:Uncharacterized protein n=1 Tax=Vespula germanica TaxID=30212 RepID=A0A834NDD1_VESGE|nr:hypothetical protein HZH68_006102 [Vespula germanica]
MLPKEEDYIDNEYYACNHRLFRLIGLWEHQISLKGLIYICFIYIILAFALFPQIYMLFTLEPNINLITKSLETTLPTVCFGSCYCNLLLKTAIMKKILRRIKCDWGDLANKPELKILKKYANVSKLSTMVIAKELGTSSSNSSSNSNSRVVIVLVVIVIVVVVVVVVVMH